MSHATVTQSRSLDPILLIGSLILIAAVMTWVVPAGRYLRAPDPRTGQTLVVPGSYQPVASNPVGPWGVLLSIPQGLAGAAAVVFYVFLAGGALTVVEATGAIGNTLDVVVDKFGDRPRLIVLLASSLFLVGGASYAMYEEILAFIPLLCVLMRRLRLDNTMALGVSLGTTSVAQSFSPFDTFHLGISQPMAELPLFSGFGFRLVTFTIAMAVWLGFLVWGVGRERATGVTEPVERHPPVPVARWEPRTIAVLTVMNAGMASLVLGAIYLAWGLVEFSAVFVAVGFAAGLVGGLGWRTTAQQFAEGFRRLAFAAMLVGFARAITVVLENGAVLDTISQALFGSLRHLPQGASAVMLFVSEALISFPMPSDSGKAMITLPVMIPLADLLGLSRQLVVNAYTYSGLVSGLVTPAAGSMLAMLALAEVPYGRWLRFIAIPVLILFALSAAAMAIGTRIGI